MRIANASALLLAICLTPAAAQPGPVGPDILVGPGNFARCPAVAMSAGGDFEVVWDHHGSASLSIPQGVFARHFDRQGRPTQASEIRLDSPGNEETYAVNVVALPEGGYFVAWREIRIENGLARSAIVGRFLSPAGRPRSPALLLARIGGSSAVEVVLTVVNDSLLVAWLDFENLRARRYDFAGKALGDTMLLTPRADSHWVDLAPLADSFVTALPRWNGKTWNIFAQRYSLAGEPLGPALRVNEVSDAGSLGLRVASDGHDRFAVAWTPTVVRVDPQTGRQIFDNETRARFFDSGGANGPEARPNQLPAGNQSAAGLAMNSRGETLVTWSSDRNPATSSDVAGRLLDSNGRLASKAFPILQNLRGIDFCPAAASNGGDEWVVAWLKLERGIFARRLVFGADPSPDH